MSGPAADSYPGRACPLCGTPGGRLVHEVPTVPVHSCLVMGSRAEALAIGRGALAVVLCSSCGAMTNRLFAEHDMAYSSDYEDSQAFSPTFLEYARGLAARWVDGWELSGRTVLEIGAGRGDFSRLLAEAGAARVVAMDPTIDPVRFGEPDERVTLRVEEFTDGSDLGGVDAVAMRHVLEHVDDPGALLRALRAGLADRPDVPVLVEIPEAGRILDEGAFWDLYHEHCNYLTTATAVELFEAAGFEVERTTLVYGGQYLLVEARATGSPRPMRLDAAAREELTGAVHRFRDDSVSQVHRFVDLIARHAATGRVALWGSGSKGTAFLHALGPTAADVDVVIDVNPFLAGKFIAGTGHPILAPEALRSEPVDLVVVMNPVYLAEIGEELGGLGCRPSLVALGTTVRATA